MQMKPSAAKIVNFETRLEPGPTDTAQGPVIWADVRIEYVLAGLAPTVVIRLPVPWDQADTDQERRSKALRSARELIDHACQASGFSSGGKSSAITDAETEMAPLLEGVAQELGLTQPTTKPRAKA